MKVAELLEKRRQNWQELEQLCSQINYKNKRKMGSESVSRFAALYRATCADLALADAYQLPPNTVQYLHRLVGRAHNQLYRSHKFNFSAWGKILLVDAPRQIFNDRCVQAAFCLFWGAFLISAFLAYSEELWPGFAEQAIGKDQITAMQDSFKEEISLDNFEINFYRSAFYIQHNTSIGLKCFATSLLIIPGLMTTLYNAVLLGASFGYMFRPDTPGGENFREFVTAHGPFELTAIVLSAGAGLRLGVSWLITNGLTRRSSLIKTAKESMPIMGAAMALFFMAAMIEGFISPTPLWWSIKAGIAVISSGLMMFYFLVLGFPWEKLRAPR